MLLRNLNVTPHKKYQVAIDICVVSNVNTDLRSNEDDLRHHEEVIDVFFYQSLNSQKLRLANYSSIRSDQCRSVGAFSTFNLMYENKERSQPRSK